MKKHLLKSLLAVALLLVCGNVWGETAVLFHETFGNNINSARAWNDSYSVKSGVNAVYSDVAYTITNAKQGKNTTGHIQSGINQTTQGTDAVFEFGPLNVSSYSNLQLSYYWKAASIKGTYTTKVYYKTTSDIYTEVSTNATGATTFVNVSVNLPTVAQCSTLYLKIVFNTSNAQAIIDEVELTGEETPSKTLQSIAISGEPTKKEYNVEEEFDPAGLVVTGTYSDNSTETIISGITWSVTPNPLTAGTTSVSVTATVGNVTSAAYTVNGITVIQHVIAAGTYNVELNNALYGISTGNNGTEQSTTVNDISVVSGCKSDAQTKTYYDTGHIRYYIDSYLKISVPDGYQITKIEFAEPTSDKKWDENIPKIWTGRSTNVDFNFAAQTRIVSMSVTYEEAKAINSIAISGTASKTSYYEGDTFDPAGLIVTATYSDASEVIITDDVEWSFDPATLTAETTSVSVTATYEGVTSNAIEVEISVIAASLRPTEIVDFTEVYSSVTGSSSQTVGTYNGQTFTLSFAKPESSSTPTKYYANGTAVRAYKDNTITVNAKNPIVKVVFDFVAGYVDDAAKVTMGSINNGNWWINDGTTKEATITFSKTCRFTAITVYYQAYTRDVTEGNLGTICLPYAVAEGDFSGAKFYSIAGKQVENNEVTAIVANEVTALEAGKPYLFKATGNKVVCAYSGDEATTAGSDNGLVGTFEAGSVASGMYVTYGTQIVKAGTGVTIGANKAYINMSEVPTYTGTAAIELRIGGATMIDNMLQENADNAIYDLQGRKVENATKGLYIVNGKKVFVK